MHYMYAYSENVVGRFMRVRVGYMCFGLIIAAVASPSRVRQKAK